MLLLAASRQVGMLNYGLLPSRLSDVTLLQFMVYPHMLPSKSPSSQSPFPLPPPLNQHVIQTIQQQQSITAGSSPGPSHAGVSGGGATGRGGAGEGEKGSGTGAMEEDAASLGEESPMNVDRSQSERGSSSVQRSNAGGAHHGTTTAMMGPPIHKGVERYKPRIFGFPVHEVAVLHRWQERVAEQMSLGTLHYQQMQQQQQQQAAAQQQQGLAGGADPKSPAR